MLNLDIWPYLPSPETKAEDWNLEERCLFAADFYNSWYIGVTVSMIRYFGHDATYRVHEELLKHHQEAFFIEGLEKLGLTSNSDPERCAQYHQISNALGGVRTRYATESPAKSWLFYYPADCASTWPGPAILTHSRGNMLADYRGWHGNNGSLLGNDNVIFVATHFVADGDPYDAGYFLDIGRPAALDERVRVATNEEPPPGIELRTVDLDEEAWPAPRQWKARRNYAITWAADRLWTCTREFGDLGVLAASRGLTLTVFQWLARLHRAFVNDNSTAPMEQLVDIFAGIHEMAGLQVERSARGDEIVLSFERDISDLVGAETTAEEVAAISRVMLDGWSSIARHFDPSIVVSMSGPHQWQFRSDVAPDAA